MILHTASEIISLSIPLISKQVSSRSFNRPVLEAKLLESAFQTDLADFFPNAWPCDLPLEKPRWNSFRSLRELSNFLASLCLPRYCQMLWMRFFKRIIPMLIYAASQIIPSTNSTPSITFKISLNPLRRRQCFSASLVSL